MKTLSIKLDKEQYLAGETVKGTLNILTNKEMRLQNFKFTAYGEEKVSIGPVYNNEIFYAFNVLFEQDLSSSLRSKQGVFDISVYQDEILDISKGLKQIPFEFIIPKQSLESYEGKYAHINYMIRAKQDKLLILPHVNEKLSFRVAKSENEKIIHDNKVVIDTKYEDLSLKMELERNTFCAGEKVNGRLIVINPAKKKIKGAQIILKGLEYAVGHLKERKLEMTTKAEEYKVGIEWKNGDSMPFEVNLPTKIKKSYTGKFSRYFWALEARLNIAWSRDLHAETTIEII